jgi:predicted nuclease of predicted toxin-antitoxin system
MPERVRFHLDEQMDPDIAVALRRAGIDVTTAAEQGLLGEDDPAHLERARSERRVVVTDDTDFLALAGPVADHPGIVYCRRSEHTLGEIIRFLILVHGVMDAEEMIGRIEYL